MRSAANLLLAFTSQWHDLESLTPPQVVDGDNVHIDSALDPSKPNYSSVRPTLFRERHGWCPYSERLWLALEHSNVEYDSIRIDNTGPGQKPSYFSGQTPQIRWPEGNIQGESMDLVREVNDRYGGNLYPSSVGDVDDKVNQFRNVFPKKSRPSSRAAFLFGWSGEPLWKSEFESVLSETDALLATTDGPFFCGESFTAADIAWAPFLERYGAQLPCLHEGLNPRDSTKYPNLNNWYTAMETTIPAYACRVQGNPSSWRKVLTMAGYGNAGMPPDVADRMDYLNAEECRPQTEEERLRDQKLWDEYRSTRPYLALTPSAEAGKTLLNNRDAIVKDTLKRSGSLEGKGIPLDEKNLDRAMRALTTMLIYGSEADGKYNELKQAYDKATNVDGVYALAAFLDERMCVPRDMGSMSAAAIKRLASFDRHAALL